MADKEQTGYKHIIRVINTDLDGKKQILNAMRKIKGVSFMFANMVCNLAKIDPTKKAGNLNEAEVAQLNEVIKNPLKFGAPLWMLNRRKDYEDGSDKHLTSTDIKFVRDNDIKRMKMIKCYRGTRHMAGLPCRGQSTKSNFRRHKGKGLGVKRKAGAKKGK